ncbi:hypothetical protein [uncultured Ruminococcus sp.]|uniref:hypothetical protein n=1 Tax=uncultured Ruminococcus sp. TaxID=165186 RepID=UPI002673D82E|nr:hypothetical protein [uncultured Ruminococcus sp.]
MFIMTQSGNILNADKITSLYTRNNAIYAGLTGSSSCVVGEYDTWQRCSLAYEELTEQIEKNVGLIRFDLSNRE